MDKQSDYVVKMESQMKKWDADVDALAAAGEKASAEARANYHKYVKDLRANRDAAGKQLKEMQAATVAAGDQVKAKMEAAWETMQKNFKKASDDLKKK
jgi:hypothetical protein